MTLKRRTKERPIKDHKKILAVFSVIFAIYAFMLLFLFAWIVINSLMTSNEFHDEGTFFPKVLQFQNYAYLFQHTDMVSMFGSSLILCLAVPTVSVISTTCAAYVLAKYEFKGRKFFYSLYILPMLIFITGTTATIYILLDRIRLLDSYWGLIIMGAGGTGMNFLLVYGLFKNVSSTYIEAAKIDGASDFRIFIQVMLPHAMGIVGTIWMLGFIGMWNEYANVKLFLPSHPTVSVGVQSIGDAILKSEAYGDYPKYFAAIIVSIIPVVLLFLIFQKRIMKLSLGGGIKG